MTAEGRKKILVVEDDEALMLGLEENLTYAGFDVIRAADGPTGLKQAQEPNVALIVLDVMLPGMTGYEVCRRIREQGLATPVIMLTARKEEFDKLLGFDLGADDYVTKPFSIRELLARVNAVLRRQEVGPPRGQTYRFGDFRLDTDSRTLTRGGREIRLTRTEFDLLAYFLANAGKALSRERLMNDVWGTDYSGTQRSLDSFMVSLRRKIEKNPSRPAHIQTVHGVGYKFVAEG